MKSLTTIIQNKELILTKAKDADLIKLSFDKDRFTASNTTVMKGIYKTIENGYLIKDDFEDKISVMLVQDNYLFFALIKDKNSYEIKKGLKRQKRRIGKR